MQSASSAFLVFVSLFACQKSLTLSFFSLFLFSSAWEHLVTLHEEIARWKQLLVFQKVVPVNIMVLAGRYLVWANVAISGTYFFGTPSPDSCQGESSESIAATKVRWGRTTSHLRSSSFLCPFYDDLPALFSAIFTTYALIYFNSAFVFVLRLRALYQDSKRIRVSCYVALSIVGGEFSLGALCLYISSLQCMTSSDSTSLVSLFFPSFQLSG